MEPLADADAATATPAEVVKHLVELSRRGSEPIPNSDVLFSALAVVSHCYSVPVPSHSAGAIADALHQVHHMMQQHRLFAEIDPKYEYTAMQKATIEVGLRTLWAHVTTYQLHNALIDIVRTIDPLPRAIMYWKKLRKRHVRATLQDGPMEWFLPSSERITIDEKIRSLEATLEEHLKKVGMLKELTSKSMNESTDIVQLTKDMQEGLRLLELVHSTSGIIPPRKGEGTFMKMDPLPFVAIEFADSIFPDDHDGIVLAEDVLESFQRLEENLNRFKRAQEQFVSCFKFAMARCFPPSKLRQRWLHVTVAALCVTTGGIWVFNNQKEFQAAATTFRTALQEFFNEHMIEPVQAIVGEVILNQKPEIQDPGALLDTKLSLQRMLSDFVKDTNPSVSKEELQRVMNEMDMSVVSLQYEKQLSSAVRNLMSGDIVRMLLIQVQFIKKELMVAMGAIDELMHANQLNLQIMATVPTFIVFGGVYTLAKNVFAYIYKRTSERLFYDPSEIAGFLRNNLRDIERLLNKQNRSPNGQQEEVLGVRDLGFLILLLHQLRDIFDSYKMFFQEEEQERFEEDLNDLIEEGLLVSQQLAVIQRMYHSHPFLYTNTKATARSLLS
uniref:Nuclear control of ATPase protein 2 n=1 Tax=Globisporangium ultimum (strain ATCC 200006 / CBS 805.95 / DAOM BR144) TaxID=431595 RepID=K3WDK6_GLOUD